MVKPTSDIPISGVIRFQGNSVILQVGEYLLTLNIESTQPKKSDRIKLAYGQTLFDVVLDAARAFVAETGQDRFSAADLYHVAVEHNPELSLKKNSWNSHVMSSAPNHKSYKHYTARRRYFRYLGNGSYILTPEYLYGDEGEKDEKGEG